jgi:hypothetical protein
MDNQQVEPGFERRPSGLLVPDAAGILGVGRYAGRIIRCGETIDEFDCKNLVVNQGLNYLLGAALGNQTVITSWYIGLFSGNYTVLASDTASGIASAATEVTAYAAGARQAWTAAAPASQSITNSASQASFTFNGSATIYGAFLISSATINGTSGTLFSGAQFGASKSVVSGDILQLTYTYTAASA